jgi:hypothetical protein
MAARPAMPDRVKKHNGLLDRHGLVKRAKTRRTKATGIACEPPQRALVRRLRGRVPASATASPSGRRQHLASRLPLLAHSDPAVGRRGG